jgi:TIR domain
MPSTDKRPLKVFLCHAHADRDPVRALYTRLTNDGVDAWFDKEKLLPGQDWELEIKKAVRAADVVVVCLSNQFNQRGFRQKEVRLALDTAMEMPEGEIFIIPARLEECDNLESLRRWHWVDLFENDGYEMLLRALQRRANNIGATLQAKKSRFQIIPASRSTISQKDNDNKSNSFEDATNADRLKHSKKTRKTNTVIFVALIGFIGTLITALINLPTFVKLITANTPVINVNSTPTTMLTFLPATNTLQPTITSTPIPPDKFLFQRNFEDGNVGNWSNKNGIWDVVQEPDGNHCLTGSGPSTDAPQIWYNGKVDWTDYALETRVKFTTGRTLYILIYSNVGTEKHYGAALNDVGFSLMNTWTMISDNIPMGLAPIKWYTIRVEIKGDTFSAYIDNTTFLETKLSPPLISQGGFGYVIDNGDNVCFDDIRAWSLK